MRDEDHRNIDKNLGWGCLIVVGAGCLFFWGVIELITFCYEFLN